MFNKILLICLLLAHLQITTFAMETEERPTESWFRLISYNKVMPEINDQNLVQLRITQRSEVEKVKRCSFLGIFRTLFKPAKKMTASNSAISIAETIASNVQPEEDNHISLFGEEKLETEENAPLFEISERPSSRKVRFSLDEELIPPKQKHIEFIPLSEVEIFQEQKKYLDRVISTADEELTFLANDLIFGTFLSCNIGTLGKFTLNDEHGPFTEELPSDISWFIKKIDSKIAGLAIRWYDEDDDSDDECAAIIYKILLIPEYWH